MKKVIAILTALVLVLAVGVFGFLNGWFCKHEWQEPDCVNPQTCTKCGKTEGMPEGHIWLAATCLERRTCEVCGATKGAPKGHDWLAATCEEPETCQRCYLKNGEALGHIWLDATTEAPKTCETCGKTEGERIITDPRFTTAAAKELLGKWACELELNGEALGDPEMEGSLGFVYILNFGPAGDLGIGVEIADEAAFMEALIQISIEIMYQDFQEQGYGREDADAAMWDTYGMNVEQYIRASLDGLSFNDILASIYEGMNIGGVYYVEGGQLYSGATWEAQMEPSGFTLENGVLVIEDLSEAFGFDAEFVRLPEENKPEMA